VDRALDLDFEGLLADARERTGLSDFGSAVFREPLRRLLRGLEEEAGLNAQGRRIQRERILGFLVNRLEFEAWWQRHPGIARERIAQPVVIIGLGRTGTTLLQRLLAANPRFYSTLWWEARFPIPFPGETLENPEKRIARALAEVEEMYRTIPDLESMHPVDALQADEEILLLEQSFFSSTPEAFARLPDFAAWLDAQDQTPGYAYLERLLQFLQWQKRRRGIQAERWILKSPHHIHYTDVLLRVFPDARIVQTHRDPLQVIPSWASLNYGLWQQGADRPDPVECGRHWSDKMARGMARCMRVRDAGNQDRFLDLDYREIATRPFDALQRVYDFIGWELTPQVRTATEAWRAHNAREQRPAHEYALETFGFTEAGLRAQYREYIERFIAPARESRPPA
jgi:hypothetical protein